MKQTSEVQNIDNDKKNTSSEPLFLGSFLVPTYIIGVNVYNL